MIHKEAADTLEALSMLQESIRVTLDCIIDYTQCPKVQTLAYIANDYASELNKTIQAMQTGAIPPSPAQKTSR